MARLRFVIRVLFLLAGAGAVVVAGVRAGVSPERAVSAVLMVGQHAVNATVALARLMLGALAEGRQRAPAVLAGLAAIGIVPLLAVAVVALRRTRRAAVAARKRRAPGKPPAELPRLARVWIDVDGPRRLRMRLAGEMLRIGRDEDNDLRLQDVGVQRYHAVIQRTADAEFILLDVSGGESRGTIVNGRRRSRARLSDGDQIQFGRTRVTFHFEPISHTVHA